MANRNKFKSSRSDKSAQKSGAGIFRIIGGQWKGRKLRFTEVEGLRPSLDRIRETLFNWLQADIHGATCLDLFAGSGAIGLEALSRGANEVQFIEFNRTAAKQLNTNLELVKTEQGRVLNSDALKFIETNQQAFDIIFIDPPFHKGIAQQTIEQLTTAKWLAADSLIYIETEQGLELEIPENWELLKNKKAGQLLYKLYRVN